jgi:hypothetical protein
MAGGGPAGWVQEDSVRLVVLVDMAQEVTAGRVVKA